jgi:D-tagatose-1,6-bisphosphate aldolase subunit GatZ/KbaZ
MKDLLGELRSDHLAGRRRGLVSICSAHPDVLTVAMQASLEGGPGALLVEVTANQVNQFGGYTGLTPDAFVSAVNRLAGATGFPIERLIVGADHLGPYVWRSEPAESALGRCEELVRRCIRAGFRKLHLDTGFGCADDPGPVVPLELAVERAVRLCRAAEAALADGQPRPYYVVGAEVPPPGGSLEGEPPAVTPVAEVAGVLQRVRTGLQSAGLASAWERVIAVVVQPGVEFGDERVAVYRPERAAALSAFHAQLPGIMTYEIHSTDYQPGDALAQLTADHFTLLKVGPCLTHAFHDAVLALEKLEQAWRGGLQASGVAAALEAAMVADPANWRSHYRGTPAELRRLRQASLRDRARYYWGTPGVQAALARLWLNLRGPLPYALIERFFPGVGLSDAPPDAAALIRARIRSALRPYLAATA